VVAVGEDGTGASRDAIYRARNARADGFHAAAEHVAIARLDDEMRVISLQGIVHETKAGTRACDSEAPLELVYDCCGAERRHVGAHPQGDVCRQRRSEVCTRGMR
jgi:hypothetical protein